MSIKRIVVESGQGEDVELKAKLVPIGAGIALVVTQNGCTSTILDLIPDPQWGLRISRLNQSMTTMQKWGTKLDGGKIYVNP